MNLKSKYTEYRLRQDMEQDIIEMMYTQPHISITRNAFISMFLNHPPEVVLNSYAASVGQSPLLEDMMKNYYVPFIHSMYNWIKMFGIYPWRPVKIPKTTLYKPWIPPLGSGYITTYMDKKHNQKFRWYWNDTQYNTASLGGAAGKGHDSAFRFGVKYIHTQPGIHGEIRSDLASVLFEYKTLKIARTATETVVFHQAEPQHIIEHHPPKINQGDDNLVTLESFGEAITGEIQHMQESIRSEQICIRSDALEQSIMQSIRRNRGVAAMFGKSDTLYSESDAERKRRELSNGLDKAVTLKPDFSYKAAQMPKLSVKLEELEARFNSSISAIMDFPNQMIEGTGSYRTANVQGNLKYLNGRIKDWITFFRTELKRVFLILHGDDLSEAFQQVNAARAGRGLKAETMMYAEDEVEIVLQCSPVGAYDDIKKLFDDSVITDKVFRKHAADIFSLTEEELEKGHIERPPVPPKKPTAPAAKKIKT